MASIEPFRMLETPACSATGVPPVRPDRGVRAPWGQDGQPACGAAPFGSASGSVLPTAPRQIRLWFSDPVEAVSDPLTVKSADGTRLDRGDGVVDAGDRSLLTAAVQIPAPGTYTVNWRVVSADGHPISGNFMFSVGHVESTRGGVSGEKRR